MPPLPVISGREAVQVFVKFGWKFSHRKGSHIVLKKEGAPKNLAVPDHKEVKVGTLRDLIGSAGLTVAQFVEAMKRK